MKDEFMVLPTDISAEMAALKAKIGDALDKLERIYKKQIKGKAEEDVRRLVESLDRARAKRLTLTPHFEPEERVVFEAFEKSLQEGMLLFEEEMKAEEEKEAAQKKSSKEEHEGSDRMMIEASDHIVLDTSDKDKGKAIMDSEPPSYVLKLQEDVESQKIKQAALEEKVDKIAENQKDMNFKLDAILAFISKKP
ncbi:hypothetical protein A2U01_0026745 [Trifolium medium]|uniref:Uncharacterized protein n=1 Tax=Trifolium medium TaxID=97028 RepID=A0A392P1S3_9FABA|nr:hypothetical protein [Trifolium medium]